MKQINITTCLECPYLENTISEDGQRIRCKNSNYTSMNKDNYNELRQRERDFLSQFLHDYVIKIPNWCVLNEPSK